MEEKIKKLSEKYLERVMELRRELHKYPEILFWFTQNSWNSKKRIR